VFAFTKELVLSVGIGAVEVIVKLVLYYFHERIWQRVKLGKRVYKPNPTGGESDITQ
jgi:adenylylsulfate kinase